MHADKLFELKNAQVPQVMTIQAHPISSYSFSYHRSQAGIFNASFYQLYFLLLVHELEISSNHKLSPKKNVYCDSMVPLY